MHILVLSGVAYNGVGFSAGLLVCAYDGITCSDRRRLMTIIDVIDQMIDLCNKCLQ